MGSGSGTTDLDAPISVSGGESSSLAGPVVATPPAPRPRIGSAPQDFLQRVEQALKTLDTLRITTLVGAVAVEGVGTDALVRLNNPAEGEGMMTEIDLLTGKIANVVSTAFASGALVTMQAFHAAQVEKSQAIVAGNLNELQKLASALLARR
jgi:hypothetical protein